MRRSTNGLPCLLLAALVLFARLVAPTMAMPTGSGDLASQVTICHAGVPGGAPAPTDHTNHDDCLLCPACHLVSQAVLPTPASPGVPLPAVSTIGIAAPPPPATGPPARPQTAAQPTGPPRLSA